MPADVRERERAGLEQEAAVEAGTVHRRRQRGHGAQARAHQAAPFRRADQRQLALELRDELVRQVAGVRLGRPVLLHPVGRVHERRDHPGDLEPVDEVVQHGLQPGVAHVVAAVVHQEKRVAPRLAEACRPVDRDLPGAAERGAAEDPVLQRALGRGRVGLRPRRYLVAPPVRHGVGAEGVAGQVRVQGILDPLHLAAARDLELVFDAGALGELQHVVPEIAAAHARERHGARQPEDPVPQAHVVRLATEDERDPVALHQRETRARRGSASTSSVEAAPRRASASIARPERSAPAASSVVPWFGCPPHAAVLHGSTRPDGARRPTPWDRHPSDHSRRTPGVEEHADVRLEAPREAGHAPRVVQAEPLRGAGERHHAGDQPEADLAHLRVSGPPRGRVVEEHHALRQRHRAAGARHHGLATQQPVHAEEAKAVEERGDVATLDHDHARSLQGATEPVALASHGAAHERIVAPVEGVAQRAQPIGVMPVEGAHGLQGGLALRLEHGLVSRQGLQVDPRVHRPREAHVVRPSQEAHRVLQRMMSLGEIGIVAPHALRAAPQTQVEGAAGPGRHARGRRPPPTPAIRR